MVGETVFEWVQKGFASQTIDPKLNNTMLVLIPYISNSESFAHFHPISLCIVLYKFVMKVIANRFRDCS